MLTENARKFANRKKEESTVEIKELLNEITLPCKGMKMITFFYHLQIQ